ncbi:hypothetical protein BDZ89DRAFT_1046846 [Hymenopellis radicata]|nr:hypothetical protein BDZ89DRAFT_1046846 [Hymenopellis radicata]
MSSQGLQPSSSLRSTSASRVLTVPTATGSPPRLTHPVTPHQRSEQAQTFTEAHALWSPIQNYLPGIPPNSTITIQITTPREPRKRIREDEFLRGAPAIKRATFRGAPERADVAEASNNGEAEPSTSTPQPSINRFPPTPQPAIDRSARARRQSIKPRSPVVDATTSSAPKPRPASNIPSLEQSLPPKDEAAMLTTRLDALNIGNNCAACSVLEHGLVYHARDEVCPSDELVSGVRLLNSGMNVNAAFTGLGVKGTCTAQHEREFIKIAVFLAYGSRQGRQEILVPWGLDYRSFATVVDWANWVVARDGKLTRMHHIAVMFYELLEGGAFDEGFDIIVLFPLPFSARFFARIVDLIVASNRDASNSAHCAGRTCRSSGAA